MKSFFLSSVLFFGVVAATAQTIPQPDSLPSCGVSGDFLERNIDPQLLKEMNAQWQAYQHQGKANGRLSADDPVLIVTVMFHIAHLGEAVGVGSNLSEGQIQAALATLNNIYRARGNYSQGNDTKIEFVLANCSGIDRANATGVPGFVSQGVILSNGVQHQQVKQLFGTYQDKFVNSYVVHRIDQAGGFAGFGGDMFIQTYDFPAKTQRAASSLTFAHEMGHVLFLNHTFAGDNSGYPPDPATTVCPTNTDPLNVVFGQTLSPTITANDPTILTCADYYRSPYLSFSTQYVVNASGFTFRWLKDGVELPLSNFYAEKNYIYPSENGQYQLRVTKGTASGLSDPVTVTFVNSHSIALTTQYSANDACQGNVIKLSIPNTVVSNYSSTSWIWKKDGVTIPNQSTSTFTATQSGTYTAIYQGSGCTITSEPLTITVGGPSPTATLSGQYAIRSGETADLQLTSSTKGPYFFTLSDGTEYVSQTLTTPVPKSPTVSTTYMLASFGTHCGPSPNASSQARIDVTNCAIGVVNATLSGGTWNTPAVWSCGSIPTALDAVRISQPHTIALPADYTATAKSMELQGSVQYNANAWLKVGQE